jgi:hypothetical protein
MIDEMLLNVVTGRSLAQPNLTESLHFGAKPRQWEGTDWISPSHHRFNTTDRSRLHSSIQAALTLFPSRSEVQK